MWELRCINLSKDPSTNTLIVFAYSPPALVFTSSQMSQSLAGKDVDLGMADLNINKDHDITDSSNVLQLPP
jgi:hypothetical protein